MPRGLNNWNFVKITKFLKNSNFRRHHIQGSHHYFIGVVDKEVRQVCVPFHGKNKTIKPRTLKGIIRQSGIPEEVWISS